MIIGALVLAAVPLAAMAVVGHRRRVRGGWPAYDASIALLYDADGYAVGERPDGAL
jgi:hypothetical protein